MCRKRNPVVVVMVSSTLAIVALLQSACVVDSYILPSTTVLGSRRHIQQHNRPAFVTATPAPLLHMGMAQPEIQIKTKTTVETKQKQKVISKSTVKTGEPVQKRKEEFQDAPMFKLMLLSDDGYDPEHVITRMCAILEDLDEDRAATVYQQAMQEGKAMCGTYPFEVAELYKEQLIRSDPMIFADMQED
jgi:ATP-dependent Clp protease adapter protein ClpS